MVSMPEAIFALTPLFASLDIPKQKERPLAVYHSKDQLEAPNLLVARIQGSLRAITHSTCSG